MQDNILNKQTMLINQDKAWKQKALAKINGNEKAICKQTALDKAATALSKQALYTALSKQALYTALYTTALK